MVQTSDGEIEATILRLIDEDERRGSISPTDVARALAGKDEAAWSRLMKPIRAAAIRLAEAGTIAILRKGKPADPRDFKGVYRLARQGAGKRSLERPVSQ